MQTDEVTWAQLGPRYGALGDQDLTAENVGDWLSKWGELEKEVEEQLATLQRAKDENTRDKAAETAYLTFVQDVRPPLEVANQRLRLQLLNLRDHEPSSETAEFVKRFRNEAELFHDANAPLLAEETTLSSDYNTPLGGLTVELDGSALTLPEAEKRLLEPDRELRERAWRAVQEAKLRVSGELDALFLELLELRRQLARNAGLPNYRDFRWQQFNRFDYTPEDRQTFHDAIATEAVPLLAALHEERQEEMNLPALRP